MLLLTGNCPSIGISLGLVGVSVELLLGRKKIGALLSDFPVSPRSAATAGQAVQFENVKLISKIKVILKN